MSTFGWIATIVVGGAVLTTLAPVLIFGAVAHAGINAIREGALIQPATKGMPGDGN
jgi:hypothetical protein